MKVFNKPTDALVVFSAATKMPRPYKIKYENEYGNTVMIKIEQILYTEKRKCGGQDVLIYNCQSSTNGRLYRFELKYFLQDTRWELVKM